MKENNSKSLLIKIIFGVSAWWVLLFVLGAIAMKTIPFTNSFAFFFDEQSTLPMWAKRWANFDGGLYLRIADGAYENTGLIQAFFPLYPGLIAVLTFLSSSVTKVTLQEMIDLRFIFGFGLNIIFCVVFLFTFIQYLKLRYSSKVISTSVQALIFFPTLFFLHAIYTEALFLFLLTFSLYAYQKKWWVRLIITLTLLTATRVVGAFMIPALIFDLILTSQNQASLKLKKVLPVIQKNFLQLSGIAVGVTGLLSYMTYLFIKFNDPLYFFHVQSGFGAGRQQSFILFLQVIFRYIKILWTARPFDWKYFTYTQELMYTIVVLILLLYGMINKKKLQLSVAELAFSFGAFFLPTLTGNFSSMSRYVLVCLPIYIVLGSYLSEHPKMRFSYMCICTILSLINIMLFIQGRWVA